MRKVLDVVDIGSHRFTKVLVADEPGAGNACHEYYICRADDEYDTHEFGHIRFQKGPVGENGVVNGCYQEDLLAIVIHHLQGFQSGDYACEENAVALNKLEEAMHALNARTSQRQKRGVEGANVA